MPESRRVGPDAAAGRSKQGFSGLHDAALVTKVARKPSKNRIKPKKNPQKPVETALFLLTKAFKRRKVNGGGVL